MYQEAQVSEELSGGSACVELVLIKKSIAIVFRITSKFL